MFQMQRVDIKESTRLKNKARKQIRLCSGVALTTRKHITKNGARPVQYYQPFVQLMLMCNKADQLQTEMKVTKPQQQVCTGYNNFRRKSNLTKSNEEIQNFNQDFRQSIEALYYNNDNIYKPS